MKIEELNRTISVTNYNESVCDEVFEVLYYKYNRVPKKKDLFNEMQFLKSKDNLKAADRKFLKLLTITFTWMLKVTVGEYLEIWTYERNIPYKRVRVS